MTASAPRPVALVTGAARRIGRAIALELASEGCDVAVHHHTSSDAAAAVVAAICDAGASASAFAADLSTAEGARELARDVLAWRGRVDVLVNNASMFAATSLDASSPEDLDAAVARTLGVHVAAPLALVHALLPSLRAAGPGAVVNVGDACGARADHAPYLAAKAALTAVTRNLARDLAPEVRVNMVAPGSILPAEQDGEAAVPRLVANVPMGRLGTVEEVARTVRFLALGPGFVTGQVLAVDGGQYA
jgi:NAD(P)-dependent dehydrogenase (short-subunit alcohol dehydrogenase family)